MDVCRICLTKNPEKDILQLQVNKNADKTTSTDIIMFCLNIQVEQDSKSSTKICLKCHKKVIAFYKFKTLALKNDAYLKSLDAKNDVFIREDEIQIKDELLPMNEESQDVLVKEEFTDEICLNTEAYMESTIESDDEFLSAIKKIKYEYVVGDETKNEIRNTSDFDMEIESETAAEESYLPQKRQRGRQKKTLNKKRKETKSSSNTGTNEKQICEECGKTVTDLKSHSYMHLPLAERKRIKCNVCDKTFSSHSARYKHNKIKHLGVKELCTICNKVVSRLKAHNLVVHQRDSLPFECVECERRFLSKSILELHIRSHTKDRPFGCSMCDKKYANKALLDHHIRAIHEQEKSHLCQLCSKSFFKKYHLQIHLLTHSQEKKYECPDCGKFYKTTSTLKSHRLTHGDVRNFACKLCTQTFKKREYLLIHMLSHTKEKRYPCQYCSAKFHRSDHRKRHEFTAHQKHLIASRTWQETSTT